MFRNRSLLSVITCTVILCSSIGCATFSSPFGKKMPKATAANPAVQIICLWQPGEGNDPEGRPCKGFAGQILFLSNRSALPLQIDGSVRVYLFDDQGTTEEQAKPLRVFEFDSGSWDIHLTKSSLGPTYSVFIPYTRRGVVDANCSLRVRLKPKQGPIVFSEFSNMPLSGGKKPLKGDDAKPFSEDELKKLATDSMTSVLRRTTTISMGPNSQSSESIHEVKQPEALNQIQLASHQTPAESSTANSADAERIKRLEAMVQQLLEQKSSFGPSTAVPAQAPAELSEEQMSPVRESTVPRAQKRQRNDERQPAAASRRNHPLDDELDAMDASDHRRSRTPNSPPERDDASHEMEPYRRHAR